MSKTKDEIVKKVGVISESVATGDGIIPLDMRTRLILANILRLGYFPVVTDESHISTGCGAWNETDKVFQYNNAGTIWDISQRESWFCIYRSATQTLDDGAWKLVGFDSTISGGDINGGHSESSQNSSYYFLDSKMLGWWKIFAMAEFAANANGARFGEIRWAGTTIGGFEDIHQDGSNTCNKTCSATVKVTATTQYVNFWVKQTGVVGGLTLNGGIGATMMMGYQRTRE